MPVTTQPPPSTHGGHGPADVATLHAQEVARLVAYLASSDRHAGAREAEDVAAEAFLEVASTWPRTGSASSAEVYLFACAHRIAVARSHLGRSGHGDALAESMPAFGDQADLARLAVLQDALDQLPAAPRYAVLLREMCGFAPRQSAEIIGLPEATVELARDDALRSLVPVVESGTLAVHARRGPLSPDDFTALSRVLQHPDEQRLAERRRLGDRLAGGGPHGGPAPAAPATGSPGGGSGWSGSAGAMASSYGPSGSWSPHGDVSFALEPGWSRTTPLDAPLSMVDMSGTTTPIFDAISAWFATDSSVEGEDSWAALDDGNWREANTRAAAAPQVAGLSDAGLPKRRPGANTVPSAAEVGPGSRSMFGGAPRVDAGQVRHRLDSFQQGVHSARRLRDRPAESGAGEPERPWDPLFDPMPARRSDDAARTEGQPRTGEPRTGEQDRIGAAGPGRRTGDGPTAVSGPPAGRSGERGRDDDAFRDFHRQHLPQVLAALLLEGAPAGLAAEVAQTVFDEAYWQWSTLPSPQDWTRSRALALFAERRGGR